jgi:hypothetical protein
MSFDDRWITECANDLISKPGASLVVAGAQQPVVVQLMAYGINARAQEHRHDADGARVPAQSAHQQHPAARLGDGGGPH